MPAASLPPVLEEKFEDLIGEVRRMLILRGTGWLVVVVLGFAAISMGLDTAFRLSSALRCVLFFSWVGTSAAALWFLLLKPIRDPLSPTKLATLIERYFPGLSERLTTLIELSEKSDPGNGSRALIQVLAKETDQRTRRLDFTHVAPRGSTISAVVLAIFVTLGLLVPLVFANGSGERVRRFVLPWYTPPVELPFRVVVSSGDPVIKRGEPVTLTAYLEPKQAGAVLPTSAVLIVREKEADAERKLPMSGGESAAYHLTRPGVSADFEYCVESGPARSEWHTVAVVEPISLTDGTRLTVHPPRYAEGIVASQSREGFGEFDCFQFSRVSAVLKFSRSPADVSLEWRTSDPAQTERISLPMRFDADRLSANLDFEVPSDGTLMLVITGERGLRSELPAAVRATPDLPPRFERVIGLSGSVRNARPDDRVPLEFAAQDDIRLLSFRLEYCVNGNEKDIRVEPITVAGLNTPRAEGKHSILLAGKAREGEALHFRIRATDNRSVPEKKLTPQSAVYPLSGWAILHLTSAARPLHEQEILAQRDKVRDRLTQIVKFVTEASQEAGIVRGEAPNSGPLSQDQAVRLKNAREKSLEAGKALDELSADTGLTPELQQLSATFREVAEGPLRAATGALKTAETDLMKASRDKALLTADEKFAEVLSRLAALDERNEKVAQNRLDRHNLNQIAEDQKALAEQAATPDAKVDELAKKQRDLLSQLNDTVHRSPSLKGAMDAVSETEMQDLLAKAKKLTEEQAALNRSTEQTEALARKHRTEELARKQRELAEDAKRLAQQTETASRLAGNSPFTRQPFEEAAQRLSAGNTTEALSEQEKAARELDRLAESLAKSAQARGDRREAARQIARWQEDLRRRVADSAKPNADGRVPEDQRERFQVEQRAVREAAELLKQPNAEPELAKVEQEALQALKDAEQTLSRKTGNDTDATKRAADALARLAEKTPTWESRSATAKNQLDQLRKEQDAITRDANDALRDKGKDTLGKKLDTAAAKQDVLSKKLRQLDIPGHDSRREASSAASDRAATDLRSGLTQDIPVSQQEARRQLDRLRQALDGQATADEQADELLRLQRDIADAAARLPNQPTAEDLKPLQQLQREVNRRLTGMTAPEAAGQLAEAKERTRNAEESLRKGERVDELRKKTREAAENLARLADRLSGAESDRDRVERLTRERNAQSEKARQSERQPASPEATAEAQKQIQRQLEELEQTRVGKAQSAKQKAVDALQKLRQAADPARNASRQQDAADALKKLAEEMARNGDRDQNSTVMGPPKPNSADELRRLSGNGNLPTEQDAEMARELAKKQRTLRDAASEAAAELAKGIRPADKDELAPLVKEQEELARSISKLRDQLPGNPPTPGTESLSEASKRAKQAADRLRSGSVQMGLQEGTETEKKLAEFSGKNGISDQLQKESRELAQKQKALNDKVKTLENKPRIEAARQKDRQSELAQETSQLEQSLRDASESRADARLDKAIEAAKQAREKMAQAERDSAAGRAGAAADARQQSGSMLGQAAAEAEAIAKSMNPPNPADSEMKNTGSAVRDAGNQMKRAESQLRNPAGAKSASSSMKQAADSLSKAANSLGGKGQSSEPGTPGPGSSSQSGGNDGSGSSSTNIDKIPADIAQYLSKPWGELPGDVKNKVIQELSARYGEDYARTIKLYFEQLSTRK